MHVLNDLRDRRAARRDVRFLCVYLREAHAADVWPIDGPVVQEPRSSEARVAVAQDFARACGLAWTVLVDEVEDAFLREFSPWPFRLYVLRGDRLQVKTMPVEGTHSTDAVEAALRDFCAAA